MQELFHYGPLGRTSSLTTPSGSFGWTYVGNTGRVATVTYPNGEVTTYAYLPVAQELRVQQIHNKRADGGTLSKFDYTYDAVGNIRTWIQQADASSPQVYSFDYDRTDQLTEATLTDSATQQVLKRYRYAYDPAGNRTLEQIDEAVTLSTYDNMNRLTTQAPGGGLVFRGTVSEPATVTVAGKPANTTAGGLFTGTAPVTNGTTRVEVKATDASGNIRTNLYDVTVTGPSTSLAYDENGNLIGDGIKTYEWDAENRLVTVTTGGNTIASFIYDGNGQRVSKTAGGLTRTFVYDGAEFAEERVSTGATYRYYYAPGTDRPLARLDQLGVVAYFTRDHLGSIAERTDASGAVSDRRRYSPWGDLLPGSDTTPGFAFTGREWDPEIGLYYYRARYYDSRQGRFLSQDPAKWLGGLNLYAYVRNHVTTSRDPQGLYELHGFPGSLGNDVAMALALVAEKLLEKPCCAGPLKDELWDKLYDARLAFEWQGGLADCAFVPLPVVFEPAKQSELTIRIGPEAWGCCLNVGASSVSLAATIIHELVHIGRPNTMHPRRGPRGSDWRLPFSVAQDCFGCERPELK